MFQRRSSTAGERREIRVVWRLIREVAVVCSTMNVPSSSFGERNVCDDCHSLEPWKIQFMELVILLVSLSGEIPMMRFTFNCMMCVLTVSIYPTGLDLSVPFAVDATTPKSNHCSMPSTHPMNAICPIIHLSSFTK